MLRLGWPVQNVNDDQIQSTTAQDGYFEIVQQFKKMEDN
jgi:hypothetical protein